MAQNSQQNALVLIAISIVAAILLLLVMLLRPLPLMVWNASDSVPTGLYLVSKRQPNIDKIAVIEPPDWVRLYASSRGYLPANVWLLKPVFAGSGAVVCRFGDYIFVDGKLVARAKKVDLAQRILPAWKGCRTLKFDEVFLLAKPKNSFDSRYFGPVKRELIIGTAVRLRFPFRAVP